MSDCTYELSLATFKVARAAVRAGDAARLSALRTQIAKRSGGAAAVSRLAVDDAEGRRSSRTKFEVCRPLCDTRCERGV